MKTLKVWKKVAALTLAALLCMTMFPAQTRAVEELDENRFCVSWTEVPVYNGQKQTPVPVVSYAGKKLSTDEYTVVYSSNVDARNDAVAIITGRGEYTGLGTVAEFSILPANIADGKLLSAESVSYTGGPVEPSAITVQNAAGETLTKGVDYQVICSNNVYVGKATARIIGIGNYTGYCDIPYDITEVQLPDNEEITINVGEHESNYVVATGQKVAYWIRERDGKLYIDNTCRLTGSTSYSTGVYEVYEQPGTVQGRWEYSYQTRECGWKFVNGVMRQVCTVDTHTASSRFTVTVVDPTPNAPEELVAELPVFQNSDKLFLQVTGKNASDDVTGAVWSSSDPEIATVEDGIVTLKKPGPAVITAKVGELTATWDLTDFAALTLRKNTHILGYDPAKQDVLITWKNELLEKNKDYSVRVQDKGTLTLVTITGINNFCETAQVLYYKENALPYPMPVGDMNCSLEINDADAMYLLRHTLFVSKYPVEQDADVNADGEVNDADAMYLLRYTLFPAKYPLYPV